MLALAWAGSFLPVAADSLSGRRVAGFDGDTTADAVLGQYDFTHTDRNLVDGRGLNSNYYPDGDVAIDKSIQPNRVYVADVANHRVLGWSDLAAFGSHAKADIVIGQPDFLSHQPNNGGISAKSLNRPIGLAVDAKGNLYVADYENHRVLEYDTPFAKGVSAGIAADEVFGQFGDFTAGYCNNAGVYADSLCHPARLAVDAGNLYVADTGNHRILQYLTPEANTAVAGSGDVTADLVLGQPDFGSRDCNAGGVSAKTLCDPNGLDFDTGGNLLVADYSNHRVLKYNKPVSSGAAAAKAYGQPSFTQNVCNNGGINENSLCHPSDVGVNSKGELWIVDYGNHRIVGAIIGQGKVAVGQLSRFTNQCNNTFGDTYPPINFRSLCYPSGLDFDQDDNVYALDAGNNRALTYTYGNPFNVRRGAAGVLGQTLLTTGDANAVDSQGFNLQDRYGTVAIDTSVKPNRVYVADGANSRVLAWNDVAAFVTHAPATLVIGQPSPFETACNNGGISATSLCYPRNLAVDKAGNLYVADLGNHRVLQYDTPFGKGTKADRVFGQENDFTTGYCNKNGRSAISLCTPVGLAFDSAGNLFVGDYDNHRVLKYNSPLTTDTKADKLYGQTDFTIGDANQGGAAPSAKGFHGPHGLAVDGDDNLYVVDNRNHRVLEFNATPADATADKVFGQAGEFTTGTCNLGGVGADSLCNPAYVTVDGNKNVYISDRDNHRVLRYKSPLTTDTRADRVFGQNNLMTRNGCHPPTAYTLCEPDGVAVDGANNLYVADTEYNRVLKFNKP